MKRTCAEFLSDFLTDSDETTNNDEVISDINVKRFKY